MGTGHIIALVARVRDEANRHILEQLDAYGIRGLAPSHGDILVSLFGEDGLTMGQIAARIGRDKSTVTTLIKKLEDAGYVTRKRCTTDNRARHIHLTRKGKALKPDFWAISRKLMDTIWSGFTQKEKETTVTLLTRMLSNLGREEE